MSNPNRKPYQTLSQVLADLEANDPEVRAVVEKLNAEQDRSDFRKRMNDRRIAEGKRPFHP